MAPRADFTIFRDEVLLGTLMGEVMEEVRKHDIRPGSTLLIAARRVIAQAGFVIGMPGYNLVFLAEVFESIPIPNVLIAAGLSVSGPPGVQGRTGQFGLKGRAESTSNIDGGPGGRGLDGSAGQNGNSVFFLAETILFGVTLTADGGMGGQGGSGGKGGDGGDGHFGNVHGVETVEGSNGGAGGSGGRGARGGNGGEARVVCSSFVRPPFIGGIGSILMQTPIVSSASGSGG